MLQSDWLVSDVSEEPDMLRSSPPADGQYDDEATEKDCDQTLINNFANKASSAYFMVLYSTHFQILISHSGHQWSSFAL